MSPRSALLAAAAVALLASAGPAAAQYGPWNGPGVFERDSWPSSRSTRRAIRSSRDDREGRVQAEQFLADDAGGLIGQGPVRVAAFPGGTIEPREQAVYEAAVISQLVAAGYDTATPDATGGQVTEIRVTREMLVPEEGPRDRVSGEMAVGVSNRGTATGLALNLDLSKPDKALISTRLEARIRDTATGRLLWEGRASIATRQGDDDWTDQAISTRLADALFGPLSANPAG